jgi:hypothetical protein
MVQESKRRKTWKGKGKGKQKMKVNVKKYLTAESFATVYL